MEADVENTKNDEVCDKKIENKKKRKIQNSHKD